MAEYDLAIRGGLVATGFGAVRCDVGVKDGRIAAIAEKIEGAAQTIDAGGLYVLPGGVDSHCHIEETSRGGYTMPDGEPQVTVNEESFVTASTSAFAGRHHLRRLLHPAMEGLRHLRALAGLPPARRTGMLDYASTRSSATRPTPCMERRGAADRRRGRAQPEGLPDLRAAAPVRRASTSRCWLAARKHGCLVTVHCENYDAISWRTEALLAAGMTAPKYHAWSRPRVVEREATHRAIALAELVDQPIQVFHVSCAEAAEEIARAQARGVKVWGETCPQYLALTAGRHGPARLRGRQVHVQPLAARHGGACAGSGR